MFLTSSEKIKSTTDYKKIVEVITRLERSNVIWLGRGQCISMADIISTALHQVGISTKLVECQTVVTNRSIVPPQSVSIGFDSSSPAHGEIDTHIVCVTMTEIPMIIDASISHILPNNSVIVDEVVSEPNRIFVNIDYQDFLITYQQKDTNKVVHHYQKSILERIETDHQIFNNLGVLKKIVLVALLISALNGTRGFYDFYQQYHNSDSLIGLAGITKILDRLDRLEQKIK
jgi:hypothetical protein